MRSCSDINSTVGYDSNCFHRHLSLGSLLFPVILSACNMFSPTPITRVIALGDLDSDGDLDIFSGSFDRGYGTGSMTDRETLNDCKYQTESWLARPGNRRAS